MEYVSIDVETTGLEPEVRQVIEFGAVLDDGRDFDELPRLRVLVVNESYNFNAYTLKMHKGLIDELLHWSPKVADVNWHQIDSEHYVCRRENLVTLFTTWLGWSGGKVNVAGKNFAGFDRLFLRDMEGLFRHRVLDPGAMLVRAEDDVVPDLSECCRRCGVSTEGLHGALRDAEMVVQCVRHALTVR